MIGLFIANKGEKKARPARRQAMVRQKDKKRGGGRVLAPLLEAGGRTDGGRQTPTLEKKGEK
jgi:hypothetical protein